MGGRLCCKGCSWNLGKKKLRNRFGVEESKRECGYYGYLEAHYPATSSKCLARKMVANG